MGKKKRMTINPAEKNLRVAKSLVGEEEEKPAVVQQSIGTGALAGGGLKAPASLPGGSSILPEEERTTVVLDKPRGQMSSLAKVKDVENYDPSKLDDDTLHADFESVMTWCSAWRKSPETFMYSESFLRQLLRRILAEAESRGPQAIVFHPSKMERDAKAFFLEVAEDVGLPSSQIKKSVQISADAHVEDMAIAELMSLHFGLHMMYRRMARTPIPDFSVEDLVNLHARTVDVLVGRSVQHPAPPDDGMDDASSSFEKVEPHPEREKNYKVEERKSDDEDCVMDEREKSYSDVAEKDFEEE
jgi:hypothetical protein